MFVHVDAVGAELVLPAGDYRPVAVDELDAADDVLPVPHGVLYRTRVVDDEEWDARVALRAPAAWSVLEVDGLRHGIAAPAHGDTGRWIGLERTPDHHPDERVGHLRLPGGRVVRGDGDWSGDGWSLRAHPCTRSDLRPWDWLDGPSHHGTRLVVHHSRPPAEVRAWLARRAPLPHRWCGPDRLAEADPPERASFIELAANRLVFWRGAHVGPAASAVEPGLVDDLIAGALGPLAWDVVDDDWGVHLASGEDAGSLAAFLDPGADRAAFHARRRALATWHRFDLRAAGTPEALVHELAAALGASGVGSPAEFERWLAAQPVPTLPRSWELHVHPALAAAGMGWFTALFCRAQPRLRCAWTPGAAGPAHGPGARRPPDRTTRGAPSTASRATIPPSSTDHARPVQEDL